MNPRKHIHEQVFPAPAERVFALLHTPSAICRGWGATRAIVLAEPGGTWVAAWGEDEDDPDTIAVAMIREFDPPHRLVLSDFRFRAKVALGLIRADFVLEFVVSPHAEGATLRVTEDGLPSGSEADEFHAFWRWHDRFLGIRRWLDESEDEA